MNGNDAHKKQLTLSRRAAMPEIPAAAAVPIAEAMRRLVVVPDYDPGGGGGPQPCVHTFREASFALIGAHWPVGELRAHMERWGVRNAGPAATAMRHSLVVVDERGLLFIEARPAKKEAVDG
jgi:hypothetical protein